MERLTQEAKCLIRTGYEIPRNQPLPVSTIFELQLLFNYVSNMINETPYALDADAHLLCPNSFVKTNTQSLSGPPLIKSKLPGINNMSEIIYNNFCYAREMRSRQIASDIEKYKGKHHVKGNKLKLKVAPEPRDPIFLNNPDKFWECSIWGSAKSHGVYSFG